jgi:hypothetical protein
VEKARAVHTRVAGLVRGQEYGARGNEGRRFNPGKRRQGPGGGRAGLDEVAEDPEDLLGIGNDGEDPHLGTAVGTAQGVNFVHFCEQPCPGGAGFLDRHGLIHGVLGGCAEAQSRLPLVVHLPPFWSQAGKVGRAGPCATGPCTPSQHTRTSSLPSRYCSSIRNCSRVLPISRALIFSLCSSRMQTECFCDPMSIPTNCFMTILPVLQCPPAAPLI